MVALTLLLQLLVVESRAEPTVVDTLDDGSIYTLGETEVWDYRLVVADDGGVWLEVDDAFGGSAQVPYTYYTVIAERAEDAQAGVTRRVHADFTRTQAFVFLGLVLLAVVALAALPVYVYRRRFLRERAERKRIQELKRRLAESREDERRRIARDLHDGPLQDLHALQMQLGVAADELLSNGGSSQDPTVRRLRGAEDETHTVVGDLRRMTESLRPPALGPFGLAAALRAHADRFRRRYPRLTLGLDLDDDGVDLPEPTRLALFRITQEAMNNAAKHGRPSRIDVALRVGPAEVSLVVEDDGSGIAGPIDLDALAARSHFGLLGMQERAESVSGTLAVSDDGAPGTRVRVTVPRPTGEDPVSRVRGRLRGRPRLAS